MLLLLLLLSNLRACAAVLLYYKVKAKENEMEMELEKKKELQLEKLELLGRSAQARQVTHENEMKMTAASDSVAIRGKTLPKLQNDTSLNIEINLK